jgi:hypothetical protein
MQRSVLALLLIQTGIARICCSSGYKWQEFNGHWREPWSHTSCCWSRAWLIFGTRFRRLEFAWRPGGRPSFLCSFVFADTLTEREKYERFDENRTAGIKKIWTP